LGFAVHSGYVTEAGEDVVLYGIAVGSAVEGVFEGRLIGVDHEEASDKSCGPGFI
jgi:hypothetical protein